MHWLIVYRCIDMKVVVNDMQQFTKTRNISIVIRDTDKTVVYNINMIIHLGSEQI